MSKALQCPACGCAHPLDTLPATVTFRCHRCGQMLKVPQVILDRAARKQGFEPPEPNAIPADDASYGGGVDPAPSQVFPEAPNRSLLPEWVPAGAPFFVKCLTWIIAIPAGGFAALRLSSLFGWFGLANRRAGIAQMMSDAIRTGITGMGVLLGFAALWALCISIIVTVLLRIYVRLRARRITRRAKATSKQSSPESSAREQTPPRARSRNEAPPQEQANPIPENLRTGPDVPSSTADQTRDWELPQRKPR